MSLQLSIVLPFLDKHVSVIQELIPDAHYITIGREANRLTEHEELSYQWVLHFDLPRRDRAFRVISGATTIRVAGEVLHELLREACWHAHFHRTGKPLEE